MQTAVPNGLAVYQTYAHIRIAAGSKEQIHALLKIDGPAPTDEECKKIIEEERLKKYG